jgi:hypothetical protein
VVVLALACRRPAETPPLVNEAYQFQLRPPGVGWGLVEGAAARGMVPDAVAGANGPHGVNGVIIVEALESEDLEGVARHIASQIRVRDRKLTDFRAVDFAGEKAIRWGTSGTLNGMAARFDHTIFLHQKHLYQVLAFAAGGLAADADFEPFRAAFSLLPGQVRDPAREMAAADGTGVGWRLRKGTYENAAYGLRMVAPPGWHVCVGIELATMDASSEVGLSREAPQAHLLVLAERAPPPAGRKRFADKLIRDAIARAGAERLPKPVPVTIAGTSVEAAEYVVKGAIPRHYLHAVLFSGRQVVQVHGWTVGEPGDSAALIKEGMAALQVLDEPARERLRRELGRAVDPVSQVGSGFSFRRDRYRDFARGLGFRRTGLWRVQAGDLAKAHDEVSFLWLEEPALGLYASVQMTDEPGDARRAHVRLAEARLGKVGAPERASLGHNPALRSAGPVHTPTLELRWEMTTQLRQRRLLVVNVWGLTEDMLPARAAIDQMLDSFSFEWADVQPPGARDGQYRDLRMGFSFRPPAGAWQSQDQTPPGFAAAANMVTWSQTGRDIMIAAVGTRGQARGDVLRAVEERTRALVGGDVPREPVQIAGRTWRRARGRKGLMQVEVSTTEKDGIMYMLMLSAPFIGHGTFFEDATAGLALLD